MWGWSRTSKLPYETLFMGVSSSHNIFRQIPESPLPPIQTNPQPPGSLPQAMEGKHWEAKKRIESAAPLPGPWGRWKGRKFLILEIYRANAKLMSQARSLDHFPFWNIVTYGSVVILEQDHSHTLNVLIELLFKDLYFTHLFIWLIFADHLLRARHCSRRRWYKQQSF